MANLDTTRPLANHGLFGSRQISGFLGLIAARYDARVTRNALSKLTTRELDDIGLTHADIDSIGKFR